MKDFASYTTVMPDGTVLPVGMYNPILPDSDAPFNILYLLRLMAQQKVKNTNLITTILPHKQASDLLVDTYQKFGHLITYDMPTYNSAESLHQKIREMLRQKVRDKYGVNIPGTVGSENDYIPVRVGNYPPPEEDYPQFVTVASVIQEFDDTAAEAVVESDYRGSITSDAMKFVRDLNDTARISKKDSFADRSVSGRTAEWLGAVDRLCKNFGFKRDKDLITGGMRVIEYNVRSNYRNPQVYPSIVILTTQDLSIVIDVFVNNEKLELFNYAGRRVNQMDVPPSLVDFPEGGFITVREFNQYGLGLALALIRVRDVLRKSRLDAVKEKTLPEIKID